jgi:hypothetical protein
MKQIVRQLRRGERADFYRCQKMWYWRWRRGLTPKAKRFSALDLGSWAHLALADWYGPGLKRNGNLATTFSVFAMAAIIEANDNGAPDYVIQEAEELLSLGEQMLTAYQEHYENDQKIFVVAAEIPLEFTIPIGGDVLVIHKLKPDLVFRDRHGRVWLMEHKTAKSIRTDHLVIDNQARPYGTMSEPALKALGIIKASDEFAGILYNFLRKALPDIRPKDAQGRSLNKDGSVSKSQPAANFVRKPIRMTRRAKIITLNRLRQDAVTISAATDLVRSREIDPINIPKTPHYSCPRMCPFFNMCVAEEEGANIKLMERSLFESRDPYLYEEETTDERPGFELG